MSNVAEFKKPDHSHTRMIQMLNTAMGPSISVLLDDPKVVEIMLNPDGFLWVERLGEPVTCTGTKIPAEDAHRIILLVASAMETTCSAENPIISAELPGSGNRFEGILPPVVAAPTIAIRKKALMVFTLEQYISDGIMTEPQREVIVKAVHEKKNILIVGGTGSGKTTLGNAVLNEIAQTNERILIIEDTFELQCTAPDTVFLRANEIVSMNRILKSIMRLRPDRIVVGEVRDGAALTLLKSWNTGHPGGLATVHANSARAGLTRLEQLILEVAHNPQKELIAEAVNVIIFIERYQNSRRIKEVVIVEGFENNNYVIKPI